MMGSLEAGGERFRLQWGESFEALPPDVRRVVEDWLNPERETMSLRTSGSTGRPKEIEIPKSAMRASALRTGEALGLGAGTRAMWVLPPQFIGGCMMLVRAEVLGWNLIYQQPSSQLKVPAGGVDFCACTPMQLLTSGGLPGVRTLLLGGSAPPDHLPLAGIARAFASYGMTETVSHIALRRLKPQPQPHYVCVPGVKVHADAEGCLVIDAPHLQQAPIVTRDVVNLLSDQTFLPLGRADHVINSGGVKIHPDAVERALEPFIKTPFVVTGRPHPVLGEEVVIAAVPGSEDREALAGQWLAAARAVLPKHHAPRGVVWCNLARTETGKWIRPKL